MKRSYWLIAALLLILVALGLVLSKALTISEERIALGASPEARSNAYLAMEYFLREQEVAVDTANALSRLPPLEHEPHTLIILSQDAQLIDQQQVELLNWVAQGGHLVLSAQHEAVNNQSSSLLNNLGIKKQLSAELAPVTAPNDSSQTAQPSTQKAANATALTRLYLENEQSPAYFALDTQYHLQDTENRAHAWANSQAATHLLQLSHGQGLITVLSDLKLWQQRQIGQYDHAWLLWYLSQESQVTLFNPPPQQGLLSLLWRYYAMACVLLVLLLLLGAWYAAPRFAPISLIADNSRRRLTEHLQAGALFNLRHQGQRSLLIALQKDIKQRAQRRFPAFSGLPVAEQWQVLQQLSRQPVSSISQSMRPPPSKKLSAQAFTQHVARLQQLRNAL